MEKAHKRFLRDIGVLFNNYNNVKMIRNKDTSIDIYILINKTRIQIKVYNDYPFRSPILYINGNEYLDYLKMTYIRFLKELKYNGINCFCCNSMLCYWKPTLTFQNLIDEYTSRKMEIKNIIILSYIRLICSKNKIYEDNIVYLIKDFLSK